MKYYANFKSVCSVVVEIEANSFEEAKRKACKMTDEEIAAHVEPEDYSDGFDLDDVYE